jgi:predicted MPP superfamily phosphohydrolase
MKIRVISDIHLENNKNLPPSIGNGDLIILAGNILIAKHLKLNNEYKEKYLSFFNKCLNNYNNVLYVMGNYEHYGYHFEKTLTTIKENIPETVRVIENDKVVIDNWVFIGMTLWSNFNKNKNDMYCVETLSNDYELIRADSNYRKIKAIDIAKTNEGSQKYLNKQLKKFKKQNIFILTHHAPSIQSIPEKYKNDLICSSYYTDVSKIINRSPQIKYWVHGHVDCKNDYVINNCRVISNSFGSYVNLDIN